jgi:hypothetical protein
MAALKSPLHFFACPNYVVLIVLGTNSVKNFSVRRKLIFVAKIFLMRTLMPFFKIFRSGTFVKPGLR